MRGSQSMNVMWMVDPFFALCDHTAASRRTKNARENCGLEMFSYSTSRLFHLHLFCFEQAMAGYELRCITFINKALPPLFSPPLYNILTPSFPQAKSKVKDHSPAPQHHKPPSS